CLCQKSILNYAVFCVNDGINKNLATGSNLSNNPLVCPGLLVSNEKAYLYDEPVSSQSDGGASLAT
ncbi:MAG: hypothetical protein D3910_08675, partial [Candidatus Electrothrix sp. ATG2]|nr:hypothetical protein [Candidatus Electrothrix sp. ATG2]